MKFELDEIEEKRAKEFTNEHCKSCKVFNKHGFSVGPLFSYIFTPVGIGVSVAIQCSECDKIKNITNYDQW